MSSRLLALALAGALVAAPSAAHAQRNASISIAGGAVAAVSTLGDNTDLGYNIAAGLNLGGYRVPIGLRFEGAYNGLGVKNDGGDFRIISGTANAFYNLTQTADAPYIIGGLGAYNTKYSLPSNSALRNVSTNSETDLGLNIGGGLRFPLSGFNTFFEARYHVIFDDDNTGRSKSQFIPITFGINF